ncbi:MAG: hypothetical protein ABFC94_19040 [Syntrophomonas sp.]
MLIHEAVRKAVITNNFIIREPLKKYTPLWIKLTNSAYGCIVGWNGPTASPRWNPTAEDLTAAD